MSEKETSELGAVKIEPSVLRWIDVVDTAVKLAQEDHETTIDGLRQEGEQAGGDFSKLAGVFKKAQNMIGSEEEYATDLRQWQETREAGSHTMGFNEWRESRSQAY